MADTSTTTPTTNAMPVAFVDSSAIIALVDRDDASHNAAVGAYRSLVAANYRLFTTSHVLCETIDLLTIGVGPEIAAAVLRDSRVAVYHADEEDLERAKQLVLTRADGSLSMIDAISLAVMDRLHVTDAFAVDAGFLASIR